MIYRIIRGLWLHFTCTGLRARVRHLEENVAYLEHRAVYEEEEADHNEG